MSRQYDVLYRRSTNTFDIIAKDFGDATWFVYAENMDEEIARHAVDGLEAKQ